MRMFDVLPESLSRHAAGVGTKKVIWVAQRFRPEHASALEFLNESTTNALNFFGVQVELWPIGNSSPAPKFEVMVKPDDWAKPGQEQAKAAAAASHSHPSSEVGRVHPSVP